MNIRQQILSVLGTNKDGQTKEQICSKVNIVERTLRRYISGLRKLGYSIVSVRNIDNDFVYKFGTKEETLNQIRKHRELAEQHKKVADAMEGRHI